MMFSLNGYSKDGQIAWIEAPTLDTLLRIADKEGISGKIYKDKKFVRDVQCTKEEQSIESRIKNLEIKIAALEALIRTKMI